VIVKRVAEEFQGAHAPRARAMASPPSRTFPHALFVRHNIVIQDCFGETSKPARETRALPRAASFHAFTVVELLIVMAIILVLAGLILATSNYVQTKGQRSRAEAEIAAISAALENYKADNGIYPRGNSDLTNIVQPFDTDKLDARTGLSAGTEINPDPKANSNYVPAGLFLYKTLSGDTAANRQPSAKSYFSFSSSFLWPRGSGFVTALVDPFGNCYGYSTAYQNDPTKGFNPTFDLWSTSGTGTGSTPTPTPAPSPINAWIRNW
jgi:type II secretory pathway pseudopilin PulG